MQVEAEEHLPLWLTEATVGKGKLWLDKQVIHSLALLEHLSNTQPNWHAVVAVVEVVHPDRRNPQVGASAELVERERLKG